MLMQQLLAQQQQMQSRGGQMNQFNQGQSIPQNM